MKKFLPALILLTFLGALVAPAVLAADQPVECCKIKKPITIDTESCTAGQVAGSRGGTCPAEIGTVNCPTSTGSTASGSEKWGVFCLINTINTIVDWVFAFLVVFAILYVILGAYDLLTSAGAPEKTKSGRDHILYAAIGLLVAFIARAIPGLVKAIMGF